MMRVFIKLILLQLFIHLHSPVQSQPINKDEEKAISIAEISNEQLDSINQLLVVFNYDRKESSSVLVALEKTEKSWKIKFQPMKAAIGRNGFASPDDKYEGDGRTPTGLYRLGQLFCYDKEVNTQMPFIQTTALDKWIDDPESIDYNKHIRGNTNAGSYENLLLDNNAYKYCTVIEYNTSPTIKGKGSAIFFHLGDDPPGPTAGCVAIKEADMELILAWLNPKHKPSIILGNINDGVQ